MTRILAVFAALLFGCYAQILPATDPLPPGPHCYFDSLTRLPQHHYSLSLRNQDQIDAVTHTVLLATEDNPCITAHADYAGVTLFENYSGLFGWIPSKNDWKSCQLRPTFDPISTGRAVIVWDARYSSEWPAARLTVNTHKTFQLCDDYTMLEVRCRYTGTSPADDIGWIDVRPYDLQCTTGNGSRLEPQLVNYTLKSDVWTRYIAVIDYAGTFSLYVADENTDFVTIHEGTPVGGLLPFREYWLEINSSQGRLGGPTVHHSDHRNLVVLHDEDGSLSVDSLKVKPVSE